MSENIKDEVIISYVDLWELIKNGPNPILARLAVAASFLLRLLKSSFVLWSIAVITVKNICGDYLFFEIAFATLLYRGLCLIDHGYETIDRTTLIGLTNCTKFESARPVVTLGRLFTLLFLSLAVSVVFYCCIDLIQALSLPNNIVKF